MPLVTLRNLKKKSFTGRVRKKGLLAKGSFGKSPFSSLVALKTQSIRKDEDIDFFPHLFFKISSKKLGILKTRRGNPQERCGRICPQLFLWIASSGRDSRENRVVENKRESDQFLKILESSVILEILEVRSSSEKTSFIMTPSSRPKQGYRGTGRLPGLQQFLGM